MQTFIIKLKVEPLKPKRKLITLQFPCVAENARQALQQDIRGVREVLESGRKIVGHPRAIAC